MPAISKDGPTRSRRILRSSKVIAGCCAIAGFVPVLLYMVYAAHNRIPDVDVPSHTVPADNAFRTVLDCFAAGKEIAHSARSISRHSAYSDYADCAADAEPMLKLLREAIRRPLVMPPVRSRKNDLFKQLADGMDTFRTINTVSEYYELSGNPDRAMQIRLDGLELAVLMAHGAQLTAAQLSTAYGALEYNRMELLIPALSDAQLAAASSRLDLIQSKRTPPSEVIMEDSYESAATLLEEFRDKGMISSPMEELDSMGGPDTHESISERVQVRYEAAKFRFADKRDMLSANLAWAHKLAAEMNAGYRAVSAIPVPNNEIAELYAGLYKSAERQMLCSKAVVDILRLEVALEQCRRGNRAFPASLKSLKTGFLKSLPMDPFNPSGSFTYRANQDGTYTLYSFGTDMKDNGGRPGQYLSMGEGDIVAGTLRQGGYPPLITSDGRSGEPAR